MELGIEEEVETGHTHLKQFGEGEVSQLMKQHQQADGQQELQCLYQKNFHYPFTFLPFYFFTFLPL